MSIKQLRERKALVRKQIMDDIVEINAELSGLRGILRMKQCLLRQANQDIYRMSRASSYIDVIDGGKEGGREYLKNSIPKQNAVLPIFTVVNGGRG